MSDKSLKLDQTEDSEKSISRRNVLLGLGAATAAVYTGSSMAKPEKHDHSKMHDHSMHTPKFNNVLDVANDCVDKGQRCIAHCMVSFQQGKTELADCASKVSEMLAICSTFSTLLTSNSEYVKTVAGICSKVCEDCEKICRKHEHHAECKNCADSCIDMIDQIKAKIS
mgnify:CR=1 FL=1